VALETDLPLPGPTLSVDAYQIQQVLTNLVTNAWEAVGGDLGVIHLKVETVFPADITATNRFPIDWKPQDNAYACLEAADTGCGIADEDIEKLFDPFFSTKAKGTGIGLAVSDQIVTLHAGKIHIDSEEGKGTTVTITLPKKIPLSQ